MQKQIFFKIFVCASATNLRQTNNLLYIKSLILMIIRVIIVYSKKQPDQYEFLDLSDVDDDERTRLSTALQPINAASSALLNNDVNQFVTAGIQFAPQYEYIQSNLNWPAVPYGKLRFVIFFSFFFSTFFEFCIFINTNYPRTVISFERWFFVFVFKTKRCITLFFEFLINH